MQRLSDLFDVRYGVNLELNAMRADPLGINFVSRTARNNGVSSRVGRVPGLKPLPAGTISVAGGGSVMESFLQPAPYYSGRDLYYLTPKVPMSSALKLFYCACIRANRYRYNYGRQANRTLRDIVVPSASEAPAWVAEADTEQFVGKDRAITPAPSRPLDASSWRPFRIKDLFNIKKGKRLTKLNRTAGTTPFIGALDNRNGLVEFVAGKPAHPAGVLTVNYNGNGVAEAYLQPAPFLCSDDVNVLYPRDSISSAAALFVCTVIRQEKYRFSYGRKWHLERMEDSIIFLPAAVNGTPDWSYMDAYVSRLPFSSQIRPFRAGKK